jgi:Phosphoesterase family/Carboxypeptidase regulatory-like domain
VLPDDDVTDNWHLARRAQPAIPTARASRRERGVLGLRLRPRGNRRRGLARAILGLTLALGGMTWANGMVSNGRTASTPVGVALSFGAVNTTATATLTATTAGTTAGDLLVATIRDRSPTSGLGLVTSVADSAGNHWTKAAGVTEGTQNDGEIWYAASAASVTTVTVNISINAALAFTVLDMTGATAAPLDKIATNSGVGINPSVGPTATTSQASEIVVADIGWNTPLTPSAQTAGYTVTAVEQSTVSNTATGEQAAWQVLSATGAPSYAASFPPSSSVAWTGSLATFDVGTSPTPTPTLTPTATPTPTTTPTPPPGGPHVMVIVEDTKEYGAVVGSSNAPYINNTLVKTYRSATSWFAVQHTSPADYLELLSGGSQGYPNGSPYSATTLVDELHAKGVPVQSYLESMPSNCYTGTPANGLYDPTHNPFHYFTNYTSTTGWCSSANLSTEGVLPYPGSTGLVSALNGANAPAFVWVTPNNCDNMLGDTKTGSPCKGSSGSQLVKAGDTWLSSNLSAVLASTWFAQNGIVIITWSQGTTTTGCCGLALPAGGHIPTIVVTSNNKNLGAFTSSGDHYGTLAAIEKAYGVGLLGGSSNAANGDLSGAFGSPTTPGSINGTVTDSVTSAAIGGATVSYSGGSTTTNSSGAYTLSSVAPGTYTVTASAAGYTSQPASVIVTAGTAATQPFALAPLPATISGTVTDAQTTHVIVGATISYSGGTATAPTNSSGQYSLSVAEGTYTVTAAATGHGSATSAPVTVGPGGTATQNFALAPQVSTGSIKGQVSDGVTSASLVGATVAYSGGTSGSLPSGPSGMYLVSGLPPGTYLVSASDSGYNTSQQQSVTVTAGATTTKNFALTPKPGAISGTVIDGQTSTPISGATVTYSVRGGQVPMVVISSHSTGQGAVASPGNNYGTLRSIEEAFGLNLLGSAGNAVNGELSSSFGTATGAPHVMVIMEENQGYAATLGACTTDPYYCSLASTYASFTHWYGVSHPSLPNYLAIDSGGAQGCSLDSCPGPYSATDLGGQLTAANIPWTAYMETMPSPCYTGALSGTYAKKHNPFVYFTDVLSGACSTSVLPYPGSSAMLSALTSTTAPSFVWITPNLTDDMHDGTVQQGDAWLKANLAPVLSSSWFTGFNSTVIVTMDEHSGDNSGVGDPGTVGGTTNAASDGTYGFATVTEGSYTVTASATGYVSQSGTVTIGPGGAVTQPFVLAPQPGSISGTVTDLVTGLPIANATVCTGTDATCATFTNTTTTASDGTYTLSGLARGSYQINVVATNYVAQTVTNVSVTPGGTTPGNFALVPNPGAISGTVKDSLTNNGIANATVCISTAGTCTSTITSTDGTGAYTLPSITEGSYQVTASATGYAPSSAAGTLGPGGSAVENLTLGILGTTRDPLVQPFTSTSIWNMPIGTGAQYIAANLAPATLKTLVTDQHIIVMTPTAPLTPLYLEAPGGNRCAATSSLLASVPIPGAFTIQNLPKNFPLAAVAADGHTLIEGEPFARCTASGAGTVNILAANGDLYGDGLLGVDGGSDLSSLGGTIRLGELVPGGVISHALQIDVDAPNLYRGTATTCYRWPATKCDGYGPAQYGGTNPALAPGALLALPQTMDINSLNLQTSAGRILATAFQNYGAYIGNDAGRSVNNIVTELSPSGSVTAEFQAAWNFPFETTGVNGTDGWSHDIAAIFAALDIVNNNSPTSIGGGGTPLRPMAPPLQGASGGAIAGGAAFNSPGSSHGTI